MIQLLLFILCVVCVSLRKAYRHLSLAPPKDEHKRLSKDLYITLKHVDFVDVALEIILLAAFALFSIDAAFSFGTGSAFLIVFAALLFVFILLPKTALLKPESKSAELLARPLAYFIRRLEGPITGLEKMLKKADSNISKPEPLSKKALEDFLKEQKSIAADETKHDVELALKGFELAGQKVSYLMIRKQKARFVDIDEQVGPILLSELHDSGRKVFPAKSKNLEMAGIVRLDGLSELKSGGKAGGILNPQIIVINKHEAAGTVINKFVESAAELIFVEDDNGELAGIVYLEDVLKGFAGPEEQGPEPLE